MTLSLDELWTIEHDGWTSLCQGRGGTFYGELMTNDAIMILVNGTVMDRKTIAATLDGAPEWASFTLDDARLVKTGSDSAALVYRARADRGTHETAFEATMTSVYRVIAGAPRLTLYQQTTTTH
ncbi:DUF4440 domain-containing protein [Nesterenkonia lutea]|uniref:DUF4440 domain-containing protein n=1 Tax=Nesterenkonia lutea TaxID=272919 RepID=A0ABR9JDJ6_9MICC|nr:DUF4440 domain-containing protein [Nesterenkonia lutea]MBE1524000.1 hypothetical protein [Nesterenkonia lutea]